MLSVTLCKYAASYNPLVLSYNLLASVSKQRKTEIGNELKYESIQCRPWTSSLVARSLRVQLANF